jgi:hypothetical protein
VKITLGMRFTDFLGIDVVKPIVGGNLARGIQNHATKRIALVRVLIHSPVRLVKIFANGFIDIFSQPMDDEEFETKPKGNNKQTNPFSDIGEEDKYILRSKFAKYEEEA